MRRVQETKTIHEYLYRCVQGLPIMEEHIVYSVHVLADPRPVFCGDSLGERFLSALGLPRWGRDRSLRETGDSALATMVLFRGFAERRGLSRHYLNIGSKAYRLTDVPLFNSFGKNFEKVCDLLCERLSASGQGGSVGQYHKFRCGPLSRHAETMA